MIAVTVLAFGLLIVIHELGHYLAARWSGMRVERFSVGFGPVIWSRKRGDTEWAVSAIPLGGYVKIAGMAPGEEIAAGDTERLLPPAGLEAVPRHPGRPGHELPARRGAGRRAHRHDGAARAGPSSTIGDVIAGGAAERAGLRAGDRVVTAAARPVDGWKALVDGRPRPPGTGPLARVARSGRAAGVASGDAD